MRLAEGILRRLRFSNQDIGTILDLIRHHMHFMSVREMRPGTLKRFLRLPDFPLHLELHRLDCLGSHGMLDTYDFCRRTMEDLTGEGPPPGAAGRRRRADPDEICSGPCSRNPDRRREDAHWVENWRYDQARRFVLGRYGDRLNYDRRM
jgi:hypothetical protein